MTGTDEEQQRLLRIIGRMPLASVANLVPILDLGTRQLRRQLISLVDGHRPRPSDVPASTRHVGGRVPDRTGSHASRPDGLAGRRRSDGCQRAHDGLPPDATRRLLPHCGSLRLANLGHVHLRGTACDRTDSAAKAGTSLLGTRHLYPRARPLLPDRQPSLLRGSGADGGAVGTGDRCRRRMGRGSRPPHARRCGTHTHLHRRRALGRRRRTAPVS